MQAKQPFPDLGVSRETLGRLEVLCSLVEKWNKAINLISPAAIPDLWNRHIVDSAQLLLHVPQPGNHWVDIGSGGGFPGLVVAVCLRELAPGCRVTLIESDQRKSVFLREASRSIGVSAEVISSRSEAVQPQEANVVSARALAPLPKLLGLVQRHMQPHTLAVFPKGESAAEEVSDARSSGWQFDLAQHKSITDPAGEILILRNIQIESTT